MIWSTVLGITAGMRTMTGIAVICWAAHFGWVPVHGTWAFWAGSLVSAIVFTILALGEYVGDTLPRTPSRTEPLLIGARLAFGILDGLIIAAATHEPIAGGILFGAVGALIGTFLGLRVRLFLARVFRGDMPAALLESASAIVLAYVSVHEIHKGLLFTQAHALLQMPRLWQ